MAVGQKRPHADTTEPNGRQTTPNTVSQPTSRRPSEAGPELETLAASRFSSPAKVARYTADVKASQYAVDASIVLVGLRGSGKSSLAVLAASAYGRRLVDFERVFHDRTGQTLAAHRNKVDIAEHHRRHRQVFEDVLREFEQGCVIVCGFSDLERDARLLRRFAQSHPVIHIVRDVAGIQNYVGVWTSDKTAQMLAISGRLLRTCSNFEFFNFTEQESIQHENGHQSNTIEDVDLRPATISPPAPSLKLKRAERDFLKFLRIILGDQSRTPSHQSAYPLSQISVESREYTYAVTLTASEVLNGKLDLQDLQTGADAVHIVYGSSTLDNAQDVSYVLGEVFARVRRESILPIAVEIARNSDEDDVNVEEKYAQNLRSCLRLAPEYLVVDLAMEQALLSNALASRGNTKIIGKVSQPHSLRHVWDSSQTLKTIATGVRTACDIVQIVSQASSVADNAAAQALLQKVQSQYGGSVRWSVFNTGPIGRPSQCFNNVLTPVASDALQRPVLRSSVACITAQQATRALFASFYFDPLEFCIVGGNVTFSRSPAMHNSACSALGMPHTYVARSMDSLQPLQKIMVDENFGGASVTQPYKVQVLDHLRTLSRHARIIRAVNTVLPIRNEEHVISPSDLDIITTRSHRGPVLSLHGDNTDWIGIRACIRRGLSPINTVRASTSGLVIGAGGMARATIYAMIHMGVQNIFIFSRMTAHAEELADYYNQLDRSDAFGPQMAASDVQAAGHNYHVHVIQSSDEAWPKGYRPPTMIVSSVPAQKGADGKLEATFTLPSHWLSSPTGGVVLEHTYEPLLTALVRQIRAESHRGWICMTGLDMLPEQAFAQFELFTGRRAPRRIMREQVLQTYRKALKEGA